MVVKVRRHPDVEKCWDDRRLIDKPRVIKRYNHVDYENCQQLLLRTLHNWCSNNQFIINMTVLLWVFHAVHVQANKTQMQVTAISPLNCWWPKSKIKYNFGHCWSSEEQANGTDQLTMCNYLLVFDSHLMCMYIARFLRYQVLKSVGAKAISGRSGSSGYHSSIPIVALDWQVMRTSEVMILWHYTNVSIIASRLAESGPYCHSRMFGCLDVCLFVCRSSDGLQPTTIDRS